jgi:hypothetical protein
MFIQVIQGTVSDADALRQRLDEWVEQLAPDAVGWLGSTAGVADDGRFVAMARFESAEAARRNSDRPEQGEWWAKTMDVLQGEPTVHDCDDVVVMGNGGDDAAGFVQVMQGRVTDVERMRAIGEQFESASAGFRPDVLGGVVALHGDGSYTNAIYFSSEEEARKGEVQEAPPELEALLQEERELHEGEIDYLDLRDPWLSSPR